MPDSNMRYSLRIILIYIYMTGTSDLRTVVDVANIMKHEAVGNMYLVI